MRDIILSDDDEAHEKARVADAKRDTSESALVQAYLEQLVSPESEFERLKREEREIRRQIVNFRASDRLSREEIHGR